MLVILCRKPARVWPPQTNLTLNDGEHCNPLYYINCMRNFPMMMPSCFTIKLILWKAEKSWCFPSGVRDLHFILETAAAFSRSHAKCFKTTFVALNFPLVLKFCCISTRSFIPFHLNRKFVPQRQRFRKVLKIKRIGQFVGGIRHLHKVRC